ncbi:MAG: hydroxymethylbilane synthase [Ktedonobacteraceae bacterium]
MKITLGTRASKLAMFQTHWIIQQLHRHWPNLDVTIEQIRTVGDRVTNVPLAEIGGDGVFVTEIERALQERRIDLAVHSLKDLPTVQPEDLRIIVVGPREDVRDVFVSRAPFLIAEGRLLPVHAHAEVHMPLHIGTGSLRRAAQLRDLCPQVEILPLRGNVDTRIRKLDAGEYDGIVLASAGLHRLDLAARLAGRLTYFPIDMMLPAPGQGALALECRDEAMLHEILAPLQDLTVHAATSAERMFMRRLGAGCYLPVAAYGSVADEMFTLRGLVTSLDGRRRIDVAQQMPWTSTSTIVDAEQLGVRVAEQALAQGAQEIVQSLTLLREEESLHV